MSKRQIEIGLLYSRTGNYSLISESCRSGALSAIAKINSDPDLGFTLHAVERDPGGNIDQYEPLCRDILCNSGARHIIGCVTSWSRKEVIPTIERTGGTLWYTVPYEGFEASDHVVYTHACPNQHLLPLLDWALPIYGKDVFLTGSNYIWGWEMNRIAREAVTAAYGKILGERYLSIGSLEVDFLVEEIKSTRPDFILSSLVGASQYRFLTALYELGKTDPYFRPETCPILSCNLTECDLPAIGEAAEGLISAGPYFRGVTGWPNHEDFSTSYEAATFAAVQELVRLLSLGPDLEHAKLSELLDHEGADKGIIDYHTHHTKLPVLIAQVEQGAFKIRQQFASILGDPYLSHGRRSLTKVIPHLRVVS